MATAHLVYGYLGSGKSTYGRRLAEREHAMLLSLDEWYLRLFADGPTYDLDHEAFGRVLNLLNEIWPDVVARGIDVVLDFGFWRRAQRDAARARAGTLGAAVRLHWVHCPDDVALRRCLARNGSPSTFLVSEEGFEEMKSRFEVLDPDEAFERIESLDLVTESSSSAIASENRANR